MVPRTTETTRKTTRWSLLLTLYSSQAIPLGFFITAMPVILRKSGLSLENVGLFSAIAFPWLIKFLWAPVIDRWAPASGGTSRRHYLSWLWPLQTAAIACVAALAFLDLGSQMAAVVAVSALFMFLAATQDIAT
ncbi:MAG: MFS transporter, partial [Acidobacteria bacterium]|nr:MFS transporter [Acidobacteriota bacterium]